jgi:hypothetical protein
MAHLALIWSVKPGSEEAVAELFRNYESPDHIVRGEDGEIEGKLVSTQVYMKDNVIVRVMEVEGSFPAVAAHLGRQPSIRELESKLDEYLEEPRDMSNPQGAAAFFQRTAMECLVARRLDD